MRRSLVRFCLVAALAAVASAAPAQPELPPQPAGAGEVTLRVIGWNMQSDLTTAKQESDPAFLAKQIAKKKGVQIWGLCEVLDKKALDKFVAGANKTGGDYAGVLGTTGSRDRMAVVYDKKRLKLLGTDELKLIQLGTGQRAPLVTKFEGKLTGQQFLFVVNHLARGDEDKRHQQCRLLNQWVRTQTLPVIMVGDYNLDFDVKKGDTGKRDAGFDEILKDNKFQWVRPDRLLKTQASDRFNGVLDFVFVANVPFGWSAGSRILNREDDQEATEPDFDDDEDSTDHRPVEAVFTFRPTTGSVAGGAPLVAEPLGAPTVPAKARTREELIQEMAELKKRLGALEKELQKLDP